MFEAFDIVQERQREIARALDDNDIPYALSGSNATYAWIASVEEEAVRAYRNVEFIIPRRDEELVVRTLGSIGLEAEPRSDRILFRDKPTRRERWCDCALFEGEVFSTRKCRVP